MKGISEKGLEQEIRMVIAAAIAVPVGLLITMFCSYVPKTLRAIAVGICWALFYYWIL
jgi:ABC-type phosphate transport system permease subunit